MTRRATPVVSMTMSVSATIGPADVKAAAGRITTTIRPVMLSELDPGMPGAARVTLAHEYMQRTGSFKARGAANLAAFHLDAGSMPEAGITIASGGNAGLACACGPGGQRKPCPCDAVPGSAAEPGRSGQVGGNPHGDRSRRAWRKPSGRAGRRIGRSGDCPGRGREAAGVDFG